jgi:hypothetical protein
MAFCGLSARGQLTLMPATTLCRCCQKARKALFSTEPRMTGAPSTSVGNAECSMLTSY